MSDIVGTMSDTWRAVAFLLGLLFGAGSAWVGVATWRYIERKRRQRPRQD